MVELPIRSVPLLRATVRTTLRPWCSGRLRLVVPMLPGQARPRGIAHIWDRAHGSGDAGVDVGAAAEVGAVHDGSPVGGEVRRCSPVPGEAGPERTPTPGPTARPPR